MKCLLTLIILFFGFACLFAQDEQAPLLEKELNYRNWKLRSLFDNEEITLREFAKGKKLVLVVYFAPWCRNSKHQAPFVQKMHEKYKSAGLGVIGIGEYGSVEEMRNILKLQGITFPTVFESTSREDREKTLHFKYRKLFDDKRKWGTPFNVFLEPNSFLREGDIVAKKAFITLGELIEPEAEKFIRQKLGLPATEVKANKNQKEIEACEAEKKVVEFKKP